MYRYITKKTTLLIVSVGVPTTRDDAIFCSSDRRKKRERESIVSKVEREREREREHYSFIEEVIGTEGGVYFGKGIEPCCGLTGRDQGNKYPNISFHLPS